jgi:hypothetical protein
LQQLIDERFEPVGRDRAVGEMRDVIHSGGACRMRCRAKRRPAREKQARIILGQAEVEIATRSRTRLDRIATIRRRCTCER